MKRYNLEFKWTTSRARDSYGYNVCTLYVDNKKVARCNGGGYDMQGTVLGDWIAREFEKDLLQLTEKFYGLTFHDPNYDPGKAVIEGQTIEEREKEGKTVGLDRYQAFYKASSPLPTKNHIIPLIDGACGLSSVQSILTALGYNFEWINYKRGIAIVES